MNRWRVAAIDTETVQEYIRYDGSPRGSIDRDD